MIKKSLALLLVVLLITIGLVGCKEKNGKSFENFSKEDFENSLNIMEGGKLKLEITNSSDKDVLISNGDWYYREHIPQSNSSRWDTYYKEIVYKDNDQYIDLISSELGVFIDDTNQEYSYYKQNVNYSGKDYFKDGLFDTIDWSGSADYPSIVFFSLDDYSSILGLNYFDFFWDEYADEAMYVYNYQRDFNNWKLVDGCYKLDLGLMFLELHYNSYIKEEYPDVTFEEYIKDNEYKEYEECLALYYDKNRIIKYEYHTTKTLDAFVVNISYDSETIEVPKVYKLDVKKSYNIKKGIYKIEDAFKNEVFKSYDNVTWLSSNEEIIYIRGDEIFCTGYDKNNKYVTFARIAGDYISLFECTVVE